MTADDSFGPLDDDDYPAYATGRAAEMLGTTQGFLRAIGGHRLITPLRSAGGHRRYSRYQLRIAALRACLPAHGPRRPCVSCGDSVCGRVASASAVVVRTFPLPTP